MTLRNICLIALTCAGAALAAPDVLSAEGLVEITTGTLPVASPGTLRHYTIHSPQLSDNFTLDILLPEGFSASATTRYPVVYAHDAQNLFDPATSFGGIAWEIDLTLGRLADMGIIHEPIVVGIHNRGTKRPSDYIPEKVAKEYIPASDFDRSYISSIVGGTFNSDEYLAFIVNTLKPAVDALYPTLADRANTFIMGSSMGGLISLYAMCEYPKVFGGAACLSTHWIGNFDEDSRIFPTAMLKYMEECLPSSETHRLYLDRGTKTLDAYYEPWEEQARKTARAKGYTEQTGNLYTFTDEGAEHNEAYWAARVDRPLHFLLHSTDEPYTPNPTGELEFRVIFQDPSHPWAKVNAFTWGGGTTQLGTWPGSPMQPTEYKGTPAWEITFRHKITPTNIIFNNGTAQTADLDFKDRHVYTFAGPGDPIETTGIGLTAPDASAPAEYYTLQGLRTTPTRPGIYIRRQSGKAEKVVVK